MENYDNNKLIAKTFYGLENVLANELITIGAKNIEIANRAVYFSGNKEMMYGSNYKLRTAICILKPITKFQVKNYEELYNKVFKFDWSKIIDINKTFAIESTVYSTIFRHSHYAAQKTKDAIVDQFRKRTNKRPNIDAINPDILINLYISENKCVLSLNSSGEPLFKRGYRIASQEMPLNEVLAAGLIKLSGWNAGQNLIDPMCGTGTILIEAALMANNIQPGIFRKKFGFENWPDFDNVIFEKVKSDENKKLVSRTGFYGADISAKAIDIASQNIKNALVDNNIDIKNIEFGQYEPLVNSGVIITNPPYGIRHKKDDINNFYKSIGDTLKNKYRNFEAWILTSNLEAMKYIGLHPSKKIKLMNASLECTFNKYEIYEGTKKTKEKPIL